VRAIQSQNQGQLLLELEPQNHPILGGQDTKGLVEALAELLLEALGTNEAPTTNEEGVDEHQNHA
jgi:hypothetical protein